MRPVLPAGAVLVMACIAFGGQPRNVTEEVPDVLPAGVRVEQFARTRDGQRAYYTLPSGDIWLYDRDRRTGSRIGAGVAWDLVASPSRDALAYTRGGDTRREQRVWVLPLDPGTGLASGSERRASASPGDAPSISPDGRWLAFARDDASGVGQSVVVVPIEGGAERLVASALPSSIGHIRWTPDGRTLFVGVNPPVPFTCAESCLTIPGGNPQVPGTIRRVAIDGGPVTVVATTGNPAPGLSPDGKTLVFGDAAGGRQFVVADASGARLDTFTLPAAQTLQGWFDDTTLVTFASGTLRRVRVSLAGGGSPTRLDAATDPSRSR